MPLVPPWVPDLPPPEGDEPDDGPPEEDEEGNGTDKPVDSSPTAPNARFGSARRSIGRFAADGDGPSMRSGLGHYVRRGYGGASTATRRLAGVVRTAGALYGALSTDVDGQSIDFGRDFDLSTLSGKPADEILDALALAVRPIDGLLDSEASQGAIRDALSDLLDRFPEADLLDLSDEQRIFAVERYVAFDVYNLFSLDIGKTIHDKAPTAVDALARLKDIKDYVTETVSAQFRTLRNASQRLTGRRMTDLAHQALQLTLTVFEDYVA